jgi:hypothetical protein
VKDSTSDLLAANCDEFIFYDDLVREQKPKRKPAEKKPAAKKTANGSAKAPAQKSDDDKRQEVLDFAVETVEALIAERGDDKIWGSMVKQTMKRRRPGFNESAYGYRSFRELIEDAQQRHLLTITRDDKTGQYTVKVAAGDE